jgi:hypothetical protein
MPKGGPKNCRTLADVRLLALMANYASPTGSYPMAGRSAIWNESGALVAQAGSTGESLVLPTATPNGWTGHLVEMCGPGSFQKALRSQGGQP